MRPLRSSGRNDAGMGPTTHCHLRRMPGPSRSAWLPMPPRGLPLRRLHFPSACSGADRGRRACRPGNRDCGLRPHPSWNDLSPCARCVGDQDPVQDRTEALTARRMPKTRRRREAGVPADCCAASATRSAGSFNCPSKDSTMAVATPNTTLPHRGNHECCPGHFAIRMDN